MLRSETKESGGDNFCKEVALKKYIKQKKKKNYKRKRRGKPKVYIAKKEMGIRHIAFLAAGHLPVQSRTEEEDGQSQLKKRKCFRDT